MAAADETGRLRDLNTEMVAVLNGARICLSSIDQNVLNGDRVLEAIKSVLSRHGQDCNNS